MQVTGLHPVALAAIVGVAVLMVVGIWLASQPTAAGPTRPQVLAGTWICISERNSAPTWLVTFHADGTLMQTGGFPPQEQSVGHGDWVRVGDWLFHATIWVLRQDEAGAIQDRTELRQEIQVEPTSETATISQRARTWDAAGRMIVEAPAVVQKARRIHAEPLTQESPLIEEHR